MNHETERQQVLFLYLENSDMISRVIAWSCYAGAGEGPTGEPPYKRGLDALKDGWRLIQSSPVPTRTPGHEHTTGRLEFEFCFEKIVAAD